MGARGVAWLSQLVRGKSGESRYLDAADLWGRPLGERKKCACARGCGDGMLGGVTGPAEEVGPRALGQRECGLGSGREREEWAAERVGPRVLSWVWVALGIAGLTRFGFLSISISISLFYS